MKSFLLVLMEFIVFLFVFHLAGGMSSSFASSDNLITLQQAPLRTVTSCDPASFRSNTPVHCDDIRQPPLDLAVQAASATQANVDYRVAVFYVLPADVPFDQAAFDRIKAATLEVQAWYQVATGGVTWEFAVPEIVQVYYAQQDHLFYKNNGDWWGSLLPEMSNAGLPIFTPGVVTAIWAQGTPVALGAQGCGGECGVALTGADLFPELNNPAFSGVQCPDPDGVGVEAWPCTPLGAFAHELGHAFGLPHPIDIPETQAVAYHSIMQTHWNYPDQAGPNDQPWGFLRTERQQLWANPFLQSGVDLVQIHQAAEAVVNVPPSGAAPTVDFTPVVNGNQVSFDNHTQGAEFYYWTFGDFSSASEPAPSHIYQQIGVYTATLRASSDQFMLAALTRTVVIEDVLCTFIADDEASLKLAITCVNGAGSGTHTIQITADIVLTQPSTTLSNPESTQVVIEGNGYTVDAASHGRVFDIVSTNLHIRDLTITGGRLPKEPDDPNMGGGGIYIHGFSDTNCSLILINVVLKDNEASVGGGLLRGGCDGSVSLTNLTVSDNRALRGGGIALFTGGEETFVGSIQVMSSTLSANQAEQDGGGLLLNSSQSGAPLTLVRNTTIQDNTANGLGGGFFIRFDEQAAGNVSLLGSTVISNSAPQGGGIYFESGNDLSLDNTTLRGNRATNGAGGGLFVQAVEFTNPGVSLIHSTISANTATAGGGGIYNTGALTLNSSTIHGNKAQRGGGLANLGGPVIITTSFFTQNEAEVEGGGIIDTGGPLTITQSTIAGNQAPAVGGGIAHSSAEPMTIIASAIVSNTTDGPGGGIFNNLVGDAQPLQIINTTIYSNSAAQAGGIAIDGGPVTLVNSTIVGNRATQQGGGIGYAEGVSLINTILALNTAPAAPDCSIPATSLGHNLIGDLTGCTLTLLANDLIGDPQVDDFVDEGTPGGGYLPLRTTSPAIDAGDDAVCAPEPVNGVDQRGVVRPQGVHCDIGAVERQAGDGVVFTVTKFTDSNDGACDADCSLREAIQAANTTPGLGKILLSNGVYSLTIPTLRNSENDTIDEDANAIGDLDIVDDLLLVGSGAATTIIDGNQVDRVFEVLSPANVTIEALTIRNGLVSEVGGGLSNSGNLTLDRVQVIENRAASAFSTGNGGGLFNAGILTVANSLIANNHAGGGEASYGEGGGIRNFGTLTVTQSIIRDNTVSDDNDYGIGGGISTQGVAFIERSTLSNNATISGPGGAIANRLGGRLEVVNSTISTNGAGSGGGIANGDPFDEAGTVRLIHATIANNIGGGLYNRGVTTSTNTIIAGNSLNESETPDSQNCLNEGTFTSLGATLLGNVGNCPSNGAGDLTVDNTTVFTTLLGPLADNGGPTPTHALLPGSVALDSAQDAVCTASPVNGVDQRGVTRPQGAHCDIGAYEAEAAAANLLFVSSSSTAHAGNVPFRDEDILAYDFSTNTWLLVFDGSDVGMTKDVDAFSFLADGTLLLSFNGASTVPGLGAVDDSDIVRFTPTALGSDTAGSFAWYLRGADVGLTTDGEDIDLIDFSPAGHLVVSTIGNFAAPDVTGQDEDLIELTEATFGNPSSGTWRFFFDAPSVGLANEDLNGLWIDLASGELYLTVKDSFAFDGQSIDSDDIFICTPTNGSTTCTYRLFWDSDQHDYGSENLDAIHLGVLPSTFSAPVQAGAADPGADGAPSEDDDVDDLDGDEQTTNRIFLPLVTQ